MRRRSIGSSDGLAGDFAAPETLPYLPLYALSGATAGLLTAELLLRVFGITRRPNGFFTRYAAMVLGTCVGGALSGALFPIMNALIFSGIPAYWLLLDAFYFGVYAGLSGLFEGLFAGVPLAAIQGLLTGRNASPG